MDIPFKTFNKTDFPLLDDSDVGKIYGVLYGKVSAIKLTCINPNGSGNTVYKLPENTTNIGTSFIEVDDVYKSASVISADYIRGLLTISNGRSGAGSVYSVKLVNCTGYTSEGHSYPRQVLEHFFSKYGNIEYTESNFDKTVWESELDNEQVQADIGFLLNDESTDFWTAVYDISRKSKNYFRVDYNNEGKIYAKRIDFARSSSASIPSCDIHNIDTISIQSSRESVFSSVIVKYGKNYYENTFLSVSDTTYENEVKRNYRKIESVEEETYLVNVADAQERAYKHSTQYSTIPYIVELELFENYDFDLYDVITVSLSPDNLSADARKFVGNIDCIVIKTNPKEIDQINYVTIQIIENRTPLEMQSYVMSDEYTTIEKEKSSLEIVSDDLNASIEKNISVSGYLSPSSVVFSADKDGVVSDFSNGSGTFYLKYGNVIQNSSGTVFSVSSITDGITATIDSLSGAFAISEMTPNKGIILFKGTFNGVEIDIALTLSKAIAGSETTIYSLELSSENISVSSDGNTNTPSTVTVTGTSKKGNDLSQAYSGRFKISETINGTDYTDVYISSTDESSHSYTPSLGIKNAIVCLYLSGGTTTILSQKTILLIKDGAEGETTSFPSDDDCLFYAPCDDITKTSESPEPTHTGIQSKILEIDCTGISSRSMAEEEAYNNVIILKGSLSSDILLTVFFDGSNGNGSKQYQIVNIASATSKNITITTGISGKTNVILPVNSLTVGTGCYIVVDESGNVYSFSGTKGDKGTAATITAGTVTTLDAGQAATINNSGDSSEAIFNFGIPKGAKGDKGDQGSASVDGGYANSIYTSDQVIDGGNANNG